MTHYAIRNKNDGKLYCIHGAVQVYKRKSRAQNDMSMFTVHPYRWELVEVELKVLSTAPESDSQE